MKGNLTQDFHRISYFENVVGDGVWPIYVFLVLSCPWEYFTE